VHEGRTFDKVCESLFARKHLHQYHYPLFSYLPFLNCLFSVTLIKKVTLNMSGGGCVAAGGLIKSEDDSLFIRKQIFRHKLLDRQLAIAKTHRARSAEHIFSKCSENKDIVNSSKKQFLSHNHNLGVCPSAHSASSRIASLRVESSSNWFAQSR
jgi:hypothetical protein